MSVVELKVTKRQTGKQISKRFRKENKIPGVFYMPNYVVKGETSTGALNVPILAEMKSLRDIIYTKDTKIVNLQIDDDATMHEAVLKDVTFDPVTDKITHFDLYGIKRGFKMKVEVAVILKGQSVGVREGGVIQQHLFKVPVQVLPADLPNALEIDVTDLKIGKSVLVRDLHFEGIEFDTPADTVIVTITPPRVIAKVEPGK